MLWGAIGITREIVANRQRGTRREWLEILDQLIENNVVYEHRLYGFMWTPVAEVFARVFAMKARSYRYPYVRTLRYGPLAKTEA